MEPVSIAAPSLRRITCCWGLMALLVAFGLMNLAAMVFLAAAVLVEKTWTWGPRVGRALGFVALGLAVLVLFEPELAPGLRHTVHMHMHIGTM